MRFFPIDIGGQKCIVCHREVHVSEAPHSLPGDAGRPVDFACREHCPVCASDAQQLKMEQAS